MRVFKGLVKGGKGGSERDFVVPHVLNRGEGRQVSTAVFDDWMHRKQVAKVHCRAFYKGPKFDHL